METDHDFHLLDLHVMIQWSIKERSNGIVNSKLNKIGHIRQDQQTHLEPTLAL